MLCNELGRDLRLLLIEQNSRLFYESHFDSPSVHNKPVVAAREERSGRGTIGNVSKI